MIKGEILYIIGILFDMVTTIIGILFFKVQEANPIGLKLVLIINFIIMIGFYFMSRVERSNLVLKITNTLLYIAATHRFYIGFINIITIIKTIL